MDLSRRVRPAGGWRYVPAVPLAIVFIAPLVLMLSGSLRETGLPPPTTVDLVPSPPAFENYAEAIDLAALSRASLNSLVVSGVAVPLSVVFGSWAGFAIARLPRGRAKVVVIVSVVALMVPATAMLVGRFALFRLLGVTDTYVPLVAPALIGFSPLYVLLFAWAFKRLPPELFDVARLEGLSPLGTWWRVGLPLVRTAALAVAGLVFVLSWNDFIGPLVYLSDQRLYTLPLALRSLSTVPAPDAPLMLAGAVMATAPVVVVFVFVQRWLLGTALPGGRH
ncbi:MAG: carbohydrate ABC transporter permease [Actinomycetota bacterium]